MRTFRSRRIALALASCAVLSADSAISAEVQTAGYWTDPNNRMMWAVADNGSAVSARQAAHHCRSLTLGGYKDWRLPAIDELQRIFGGPVNDRGYRILGPVKLTGWAWSSSEGKEPGEYWALDFGDGARASVAAGDSGLNRALCVRPPSHSPLP